MQAGRWSKPANPRRTAGKDRQSPFAILARQRGPMRILGLVLGSALGLMAQVDLVDPEYVIPKENPNASPADLARGGQLFGGQCAGCHGPKGEGGKGAILAQPRLRHAPDD